MLSHNVDAYYVLNQRKITVCNVFWTLNVYQVLSRNATVLLCTYNCLTLRDCNHIDNGLVLFC